jgi:hypothetical protein
MRRTPLGLLSVSAVFLLVGCATTLQLSQEKQPAYLSELRAEYLSENPNGQYCDQVTRGLVVKGMDRFGVLASWGYPEKRTREGMTKERWVYIDADESSGDTIEYTLAFLDGVLQDWYSTRLTTGMTPVVRDHVPTTPPAKTDTAGKTVPKT